MKLTKAQRPRSSTSSELSPPVPYSHGDDFDSDVATDDRSIHELLSMSLQPPANTRPLYAVDLIDFHGPQMMVSPGAPASTPSLPLASRHSALRRTPASDILGLPEDYSDNELNNIPSFEGPDERHLDLAPTRS